MVLLGEPGIRIEWLAFPEYATYGVVRPFIGLLVNLMRHFYDETVCWLSVERSNNTQIAAGYGYQMVSSS